MFHMYHSTQYVLLFALHHLLELSSNEVRANNYPGTLDELEQATSFLHENGRGGGGWGAQRREV